MVTSWPRKNYLSYIFSKLIPFINHDIILAHTLRLGMDNTDPVIR